MIRLSNATTTVTDDTWTPTTADESATIERSGANMDVEPHPQTKQALCERAAAHAADVAAGKFPKSSVERINRETSTP